MIELRTLGDSRIVVRGKQLGPHSPLSFALALYLAIERGRPHPREELLSLLLPGIPTANAAHNLRQMLYNLRELGVPAETTPSGSMIAAGDVRDDYSALLATGELPEQWADRLPGEFLPGYWPKVSDDYARWLELQRDGVNSALRRAYVRRILDRRAVARWDEVERYARACLVVDPLNEEATLALAEALALSGSKVAGVKVLDRYLEEIGQQHPAITIPASILRKRIGERSQLRLVPSELPLIGREADIQVLNRTLESAISGEMGTVLIHGEAGIGKTRLIREFINLAVLSGARIAEVACQPYDIHRPMRAIRDLVAQLHQLPGALGCASDSYTLLQGLAGNSGDAVHGDTDPDTTAPTTSHHGKAADYASAFGDLIEAISAEVVLLIVVDDTHWADPISREVLQHLLEGGKRRAMLLLSSRSYPTLVPHAARAYIHRLHGISRSDAVSLLRSATGRAGATAPDTVIERAADISSGNPFYLRSLADHYVRNPHCTELPSQLAGVIERRIRSISEHADLIVLACALLGRFATVGRVEAALQMPRYQLAKELDGLQQDSLIRSDGTHIAIAHSLIAECVLNRVPGSAAALIRRACAELLHSYARATGDSGAYWAAYDCWVSLGDTEEATRCADEATILDKIHYLRYVVDTAEPVVRSGAVSTGPAASEPSGSPRTPDGRDAIEYGRSDTTPIGPPHDHTQWLTEIALDTNQSPPARLRAAAAALTIAEHSADRSLADQVYSAAIDAGQLAEGDARDDLLRITLAYHAVFGDQGTAMRIAERYAADSYSSGNPIREARARVNAAEALARCGDGDGALKSLLLGYEAALKNGIPGRAAACAVHATWIARQWGRTIEIVEWRRRAEELASDPTHGSYSAFLYNEALLTLDGGEAERSRQLITQLEASVVGEHSEYHRVLMDALRMQLNAQHSGPAPHNADVDRVREWTLRTAKIHPQDDTALAVILALVSLDKVSEATEFALQYTGGRRRRSHPVLQRLRDTITGLAPSAYASRWSGGTTESAP